MRAYGNRAVGYRNRGREMPQQFRGRIKVTQGVTTAGFHRLGWDTKHHGGLKALDRDRGKRVKDTRVD